MYRLSRLQKRNRAGFTLIEVMIAASVMVLVIMSSIGTLSLGYRLLENARLTTLAGQVLQSEMETLRLKNWTEISALPASEAFVAEDTIIAAGNNKFTCVRKIENAPTGSGTIKKITLAVSWTSMRGIPHTRQYMSYFAENGLNDYYYRTF